MIGKYHAPSASAPSENASNALERIADFLRRQGCEVVLDTQSALHAGLTDYPTLDVDGLGRHCDLGLVVGGDGTMLGVSRHLAQYGTPLIGVNQGRLGFVTDIALEDFEATLTPMLQGEYEEDLRPLMCARVIRDGQCVFEVSKRRETLQNAIPDALDLMIVCVEAGLGLDAAMNRAAGEIGMRSEALSEELNLVALELRMGVKRELALRNLAMRTNVDDISSFVSMLVQSDRFGTNVAEALRVQAETMRVHRRLRAEERAAKIPLKLLFPLIFFIFPSLMVVLMGPAMISIYRVLLPTMAGNN